MSDNHLTPQQQTILQMLKDAGLEGINSYKKARDVALQLPYVIKCLKEKGYSIRSIPQKNKSVQYVLMHSTPLTAPLEPATAPQRPVLRAVEDKRDDHHVTLEEIEGKLAKLREEYRAATPSDQGIIQRRANALINARNKLVQKKQAIQAP